MSANEPTKPTIAPKAPVAASPAKVTPKPATKVVAKKAPAKPVASKAASKSAATKPAAKPVTKAAPQAAAKAAAKPAAVPKAKPVKVKKPKMVRDSFTMPKAEFAVIDALKNRAANLKKPAKKTELIRAGIKALAAMSDAAFAAAVAAVPSLKTGRPSKS